MSLQSLGLTDKDQDINGGWFFRKPKAPSLKRPRKHPTFWKTRPWLSMVETDVTFQWVLYSGFIGPWNNLPLHWFGGFITKQAECLLTSSLCPQLPTMGSFCRVHNVLRISYLSPPCLLSIPGEMHGSLSRRIREYVKDERDLDPDYTAPLKNKVSCSPSSLTRHFSTPQSLLWKEIHPYGENWKKIQKEKREVRRGGRNALLLWWDHPRVSNYSFSWIF